MLREIHDIRGWLRIRYLKCTLEKKYAIYQLLTCESRDKCLVLKIHIWWRHQMETFSALLALCAGNSTVTSEFPSKRSMTQSFPVCLICALTNGWANNRDAGNFRRHRAYYDGIIMISNLHKDKPLFIYFIYMYKNSCKQSLLHSRLQYSWK